MQVSEILSVDYRPTYRWRATKAGDTWPIADITSTVPSKNERNMST